MAATIVKHKGEILVVRKVSTNEKRSIYRLSTTKQYQKFLSLVMNKQLSVNQFTGNVKELQEIVSKIKEAI